jgi:hypothetical protein
MNETKIRDLNIRELQEADQQDMDTLSALNAQPKVTVYFERDQERDEPIVNPDGSVGYIARCVNINGVQFQIPAEVPTEVPQQVYEMLEESEEMRRRLAAFRPKIQRVDLGYDHLFIGSQK